MSEVDSTDFPYPSPDTLQIDTCTLSTFYGKTLRFLVKNWSTFGQHSLIAYRSGVRNWLERFRSKPMVLADGSAQVLIRPDGTFVFDRKAVSALGLKHATCISVFYSRPDARFALQPLKGGNGVALERLQAGSMAAHGAADFLNGAGVLPAEPTKYPAQFYADLNMIVVRNVVVRNRRKAA